MCISIFTSHNALSISTPLHSLDDIERYNGTHRFTDIQCNMYYSTFLASTSVSTFGTKLRYILVFHTCHLYSCKTTTPCLTWSSQILLCFVFECLSELKSDLTGSRHWYMPMSSLGCKAKIQSPCRECFYSPKPIIGNHLK